MTTEAMYCYHANEVPTICHCSSNCYCWTEGICKKSWELAADATENIINKIALEDKNYINNEKINGPEHYNGYQVIETIWEAGYGEGFCIGNAIKYLSRANKKDNKTEDIEKALWYLKYYCDHINVHS